MDRLSQISVASGTGTLWAERYGYTAVGQRIYTLRGSSGTLGDAYWLDAISQLVGVKYGATGANGGYSGASNPASMATWNYDAAGNREVQISASGTTSYIVNDINQYTATVASASLPMTYNSRGDLATQGDWEYTNDAHGNLIQAHNTQSNVLTKYWRDVAGHRAVKDVDGFKTAYFNLGTAQLEAYDVTAATTTSTIYEPGIDRPLAEVDSSGVLTFYHQDWLGSVVMLTDASGAKAQSYSYDAWGKPSGFNASGTTIADSAIASRFLYTAREFDQETGLYHYRARAYLEGLGRFVQNDPIDFAGGDYNLYRYVANNPINWVDPLGLDIVKVGLSPVFGFKPFNHAYVINPENPGSIAQQSGSSGLGGLPAVPTSKDPRYEAETPHGMTAEEFIKKVQEHINEHAHPKPWFPRLSDCHNALERAFKDLGAQYPKTAGRINEPPKSRCPLDIGNPAK